MMKMVIHTFNDIWHTWVSREEVDFFPNYSSEKEVTSRIELVFSFFSFIFSLLTKRLCLQQKRITFFLQSEKWPYFSHVHL